MISSPYEYTVSRPNYRKLKIANLSFGFSMLLTDLQVIHERDPAARNWLEVLFGIPGRIVQQHTYQTKETAYVLNTESLPDMEAKVIGILFDRIKALEQEVEQLRAQSALPSAHEKKNGTPISLGASNRLIEDFLDGAWI
jgi:hypothetical protein